MLSNPVSVANTRMILEPGQGSSLPEVLSCILREEGPQGLMKGLTPRIGKAAVSGALTFGLFELSRQLLQGV